MFYWLGEFYGQYFWKMSFFIAPVACIVWVVATRYGRIRLRDAGCTIGAVFVGIPIVLFVQNLLERVLGSFDITGEDRIYYMTIFGMAAAEEAFKWFIAWFLYKKRGEQVNVCHILPFAFASGVGFCLFEGAMKVISMPSVLMNTFFGPVFSISSMGHIFNTVLLAFFYIKGKQKNMKWLYAAGFLATVFFHFGNNIWVELGKSGRLTIGWFFVLNIIQAVVYLAFLLGMVHYNKNCVVKIRQFESMTSSFFAPHNRTFQSDNKELTERRNAPCKAGGFRKKAAVLFLTSLSFISIILITEFDWFGFFLFGILGIVFNPIIFFPAVRKVFRQKKGQKVIYGVLAGVLSACFVAAQFLPLSHFFHYDRAVEYQQEMLSETDVLLSVTMQKIVLSEEENGEIHVTANIDYRKCFLKENRWENDCHIRMQYHFDKKTGKFSV